MIDCCIDYTVSDGLCNDLLGFLYRVQLQLRLDIANRYFGVANVEFLQTELQDSVLETGNQVKVLICDKDLFVFFHDFLEGLHVATFDTINNLEIRGQRFLEVSWRKDLPVWNFTHEKLNDDL